MDGNANTNFRDIPHAALRMWSGNPRKTVGDVADLAASIRSVGLAEPLVVRALPAPEEYGHETGGAEGYVVDGHHTHEVIAGQRRYHAAALAGLTEVPCRVVALDDAAALELTLVENSQRVDCDPIDEAESIDRLVRAHGRSPDEVAARLGRPLAWVRRRLSLLDLCEEAKAAVRSDRLPLGHAIALAAVDAETQATVLLRFTNREIPSIKSFAREIIYALHLISAAPFDAADKTLPGGACGGCPKRSDAQGQLDIFGESSPTEGAHCLDVTCWERKGEETWSRAKDSAKKRHLTIIEDGSEVIAFDHGTPVVRADKPYTIGAPTPKAKPVAITRTERGRVVELYVRPAAKTSEDDPEYRDPEEVDRNDEGDEGEDEDGDAVLEKRREERARARLARYEQIARLVRGAGMGVAARHALSVNIAEYGDIDVREAARALKIELPADCEPEDIPGHVAESDAVYLLVVALAGGSLFDDAGAAGSSPTERALREAMARGNVVGEVKAPPVIKVPVTEDPAALCARGRWTVVALYGAEWSLRRACEQRDEATPLLKGAAGDVQIRLYDPDGDLVAWWPKGPRPPAIVGRDGELPADDAAPEELPAVERDMRSHARKGKYRLLKLYTDGRVECLAEARKLEELPLEPALEPGVVEVVRISPSGTPSGSSSQGHGAYVVPGRWTVVASQHDGRSWLRWTTDDEPAARAHLATAKAREGVCVAELFAPDGAGLESVNGPERDLDDASATTVTLAVKRGDWLQHRSGLRDTAKAPLHKRWEAEGDDRVVELEPGDDVIAKVIAYCADHGVKLRVNGKVVGEKTDEKPVAKARARKGGAA